MANHYKVILYHLDDDGMNIKKETITNHDSEDSLWETPPVNLPITKPGAYQAAIFLKSKHFSATYSIYAKFSVVSR